MNAQKFDLLWLELSCLKCQRPEDIFARREGRLLNPHIFAFDFLLV